MSVGPRRFKLCVLREISEWKLKLCKKTPQGTFKSWHWTKTLSLKWRFLFFFTPCFFQVSVRGCRNSLSKLIKCIISYQNSPCNTKHKESPMTRTVVATTTATSRQVRRDPASVVGKKKSLEITFSFMVTSDPLTSNLLASQSSR